MSVACIACVSVSRVAGPCFFVKARTRSLSSKLNLTKRAKSCGTNIPLSGDGSPALLRTSQSQYLGARYPEPNAPAGSHQATGGWACSPLKSGSQRRAAARGKEKDLGGQGKKKKKKRASQKTGQELVAWAGCSVSRIIFLSLPFRRRAFSVVTRASLGCNGNCRDQSTIYLPSYRAAMQSCVTGRLRVMEEWIYAASELRCTA